MNAAPENRPDPSHWIAAALVALPFLQALPVDFDRTGALLLFLPALWFGRADLRVATQRLSRLPTAIKLLGAMAGLAVLLAIGFARQPAPATVTAASWVLLAAIGLLAGQRASASAEAGWRMLAGLALGAAAGSLVVWIVWSLEGRGAMPLYAHYRLLGLHTLGGAVASTAWLARAALPRRQRIFWLGVGALTWGGMLWSGGRTPLLAVAAGLGLWIFLRGGAERRQLIQATILQLAVGLALSAVFWTNNPELGWWHAFGRTASAAVAGDASQLTSTRSVFWRETVERAETSPWLGHGPDAYRFITPKLDGQQPHNFILQLWLDVGVLGALPLLLLLAWIVARGGKRTAAEAEPLGRAWFALLVASLAAGLLDGVFYHLLAFLPAMLAVGVVASRDPAAAPRTRARGLIPAIALGGALAVLLFHAVLFHALVLLPPPAPTAARARALRMFPSTTFGLWRWLDAWQATDPATALAWTRWAETHSASPIFFHLYAAQVLAKRGDRAGVIAELRTARAEAHWTVRPSIDAMLGELHSVP